ncbi:NAD(P)/FAD-dependent oxidoreductase [Pseudarthrobacter sp. P1]|uniref:NAD(P)/FAD-dependent oxidoreductase n=1 Tax=Pseudarthrobacter sp. P1 TaxID=3418418 RepID=UPI003CF99929
MANDQIAAPAHRNREPHRVLDVLVVGGGAAGLSAALTLARARRDVLVVDAGNPRNAPADGVHGILTREGISPLELTRLGRAEVESYGGVVLSGTASNALALPAGGAARFAITVTTPGGRIEEVYTRRLVIASGLTDELPPIPGLNERWGRDVVHCPYCHGWEIRDRAIGVLATTAFAMHQAQLFRQWSSDVTMFLHSGPELTEDQMEELAARDIAVVSGPVRGLRVEEDRLTGVVLASGSTVPVDALAVGAPVRSNADVLATLGIAVAAHPSGFGLTVPNDAATGATAVPGVWVAGNVGDMKMQVVTAAASGVGVGVAINADLIAEETAAAVAARRHGLAEVR